MKRVVVINGSHKPLRRSSEQYSTRIEAMVELSAFGAVDLYGKGWDRWWARSAMWLPYWRNRRVLMSIYKGVCESKFEILQQYTYCLCFENMTMNGYISEKIFDCLYAGTIPLYLGASDVSKYIPSSVYVDCRQFHSWSEMWDMICSMTDDQIDEMREAGRSFLRSDAGRLFYDSLPVVVCEGL